MSRTTRRWQIAGTVAVATAMVGVGLGVAAADESGSSAAAVGTIVCPAVAGELPAVPQQAAAEIQRNLALLNTQVAEAQRRLETSVGQGGPNFVQNAILGPLKGKRESTINRMATAIGRNAAKPVLAVDALATCTVDAAGGASPKEPALPPAGIDNGTAAAGGKSAGEKAAGGSAAVGTIACPAVAGELPAVPQQAAAEIQRNLALLNTQVAEAQRRLETSVGQGGPNFVQNAILGPLKSKRVATINRMATAIGRNAAKPVLAVDALATCKVEGAGAKVSKEPATPPAGIDNGTAAGKKAAGGSAAVGTIACPAVAGELPADIPAQAQAEVASNLALLDKQIAEAQRRLETSVGQGGPNFVRNAILGPLEGKRIATINRMATAIGRNAAKPNLNVAGLAPCSVK